MRRMAQSQESFLLVENEENDIILMRRSFLKLKMLNVLHAVTSGEEARTYLKGEGRYSNRSEFSIPKAILLDLKLDGMDGFEVLHWIRQHPEFNGTRIVVLTSSNRMDDVSRAYQLGANSFLVKPADLSDILRIAQAVEGYWVWKSGEEPKQYQPVTPSETAPKLERRWN